MPSVKHFRVSYIEGSYVVPEKKRSFLEIRVGFGVTHPALYCIFFGNLAFKKLIFLTGFGCGNVLDLLCLVDF